LLDATENLHRLDASLWKGIICSPVDGVGFLCAPGAAGIGAELSAERVRYILRFARSLYSYIVVDFGRLTACALAILGETKDLFVVTTPMLPALYEANKLVQMLLGAGIPGQNVKLMVFWKIDRPGDAAAGERQ
jgi:Flp pilus assembly CpaE family ATPase